jgi:hypothetical protein
MEYRNIYEGCGTKYDQVIEKLLLNNYTVIIVNKINKTIGKYYLNTLSAAFTVIHDEKTYNNIIPENFDFRELVYKYHEFPMIDNNQFMIFVQSLSPGMYYSDQNFGDEKRKLIRKEFMCIENSINNIINDAKSDDITSHIENNNLTSYEYDFNKDHDFRHYSQIAYEGVLLYLSENEKIIKKASEWETTNKYNAVYITDYGNILRTSYSNQNNSYKILQNYKIYVHKTLCNSNNKLNVNYIKSIISYDFGDIGSDVQSKIINLIKQDDLILS